jgi:hypothetical protein
LSVFLHTPTPYDRDPVNNWSQNIIAEIAGQTLHLSGYIKVQEAKEGALWVQCWRRQPWGVLKAITTSTDAPIYGTKEWEQVEITLEVPQGTDFITVRCVLLGTGAAWFDDISIAKTKPVKSESTPEDSEADDATKEDSALPEEASPEETVVINTTEDSEEPNSPDSDRPTSSSPKAYKASRARIRNFSKRSSAYRYSSKNCAGKLAKPPCHHRRS